MSSLSGLFEVTLYRLGRIPGLGGPVLIIIKPRTKEGCDHWSLYAFQVSAVGTAGEVMTYQPAVIDDLNIQHDLTAKNFRNG
jgi:hypothetical protein